MKKSIFLLFAFGLLILSGGCSVNPSLTPSPTTDINNYIKLDKDESFFDDFYVYGDKVYFKCELAIENSYGKDINVKICASSEEDVDLGLLKNAEMSGYDKFSLKQGKTYMDIIFVGDYAGNYQKADRLLPEISFEPES